ncbi:MAG TPA: hypothetical protein VK081_12075 [Planctomycetota bacterium]|nr:hypothetical protein [Planctomycetota bacterium]
MTRTAPAPDVSTFSACPGPSAVGRNLPPPAGSLGLGQFVGRSLFPLLALTLILGTLLWGPWVTLALAVASWAVVGRIG